MGGEPVAHMLRRQREKQAIDIARMVGLAPSSEVQFAAIVAGYLHRFQSQMLDAIAEPSEAVQLAGHNMRSDPVTGLSTSCGVDEIYRAMIAALRKEIEG